MRLYHFTRKDFGLLILRHKRIKISRINELNDPFELMGVDLSNDYDRQAMKILKEEISSDKGIVSFSENWTNPLLWAHYADSHRGLCLGFDVSDSHLMNVKYQDERISSNEPRRQIEMANALADKCHDNNLSTDQIRRLIQEQTEEDQSGQDFIIEILTTKFSHWSYEEEYRLFVELRNKRDKHYYCEFGGHISLEEVIIGLRTDISKAKIECALGEMASRVKKFRVREHSSKFEMVREHF